MRKILMMGAQQSLTTRWQSQPISLTVKTLADLAKHEADENIRMIKHFLLDINSSCLILCWLALELLQEHLCHPSVSESQRRRSST